MRSLRFINNLLYLVIQLVAKESNAKENNAGTRRFFVLCLHKRYISQVIYCKLYDGFVRCILPLIELVFSLDPVSQLSYLLSVVSIVTASWLCEQPFFRQRAVLKIHEKGWNFGSKGFPQMRASLLLALR